MVNLSNFWCAELKNTFYCKSDFLQDFLSYNELYYKGRFNMPCKRYFHVLQAIKIKENKFHRHIQRQ